MDGLKSGMRVSASAMRAERLRLQMAAQNIAFARTTKTPSGEPYRRQQVEFAAILDSEGNVKGVKATQTDDPSPFPVTHDPSHPHADKDGNVAWPNVEVLHEVVDISIARRAYDANAVAFESLVSSLNRAIDIGRS